MRTPTRKTEWKGLVLWPRLSIQQRLPLLICILLLSIVVSFGWASYERMKNTSVKIGGERLTRLTQQLSSMFQQSGEILSGATRGSAMNEGIVEFVGSGGKKSEAESRKLMDQLRGDTLCVQISLLDSTGKQLLVSRKNNISIDIRIDSTIASASRAPQFKAIGGIHTVKGQNYFPIVGAVTRGNDVIGYLVKWRWVYVTPKAIEQFSQLLGTDASMYIGNTDGKFWTDMINKVTGPPPGVKPKNGLFEYTNDKGNEVIASMMPIPGTDWNILVEFSRSVIMEIANGLLYWIVALGTVLTAIGIFLAWLLSRNITKPLHELTIAASSVRDGTYDFNVVTNREDEIGTLATAFMDMAVQVKSAHENLENKVQDRTAKLEMANRELEAFSYSVSHDLRAPLRAVSGYATMLKEDYEDKLDAEGNRVIGSIISNAKMMGKLIDDLIAFSKMGKKEVAFHTIDMKRLVSQCLSEFAESEVISRYSINIDELPDCSGDQNMIKQVWMNLIGNAIKYSSKKETPRIDIGWQDEPDRLVYFIKDNGVGFDMQYAHKLFGVFQRLHSAESFEGTGIGLAFVQRIISKHGGQIWANSAPGEGASFYFGLPKQQANGY